MCGVSALSLSVSHSFLSLCPLVVSRPPSPFVCVVIYFIHSFRLSICIRRRRRKAGGCGGGGIGEYETFCFAFRRQGKPELLSQTLALTLKIFEVDT